MKQTVTINILATPQLRKITDIKYIKYNMANRVSSRLRVCHNRCESQADGTLMLHYYSIRPGLHPIVTGEQQQQQQHPLR